MNQVSDQAQMAIPRRILDQQRFTEAFDRQDYLVMSNLLSTRNININALHCQDCGEVFLHKALKVKNYEMIKFLIISGAYPNVRDAKNQTALFLAIEDELPELVKILLACKADLSNIDHPQGSGAAFCALRKTKKSTNRRSREILDAILNHGMFSPDESESYYYLLCSAIVNNDCDLARILIDQAEDVNFKHLNSESPLEFAIALDNVQVSKLLLQNCADPNHRCVLFSAIKMNNPDLVRLLIKFNAKLTCNDEFGNTPLHYAALHGVDMARIILQEGVEVDELSGNMLNATTVFHDACVRGQFDVMELLLRYSADINCRDANHRTPLHGAIRSREVVEFLLHRGAEIDPIDVQGDTPLLKASRYLQIESVKLLIERGANLRARDERGKTILHHFAGGNEKDFVWVLKCTVDRGILSVDERDKDEKSLMHYAEKQCGNVVELLKRGVDLNIRSKDGLRAVHVHNYLRPCPVIEFGEKLWAIGNQKSLRFNSSGQISKFLGELRELKNHIITYNPERTLYDLLIMKRYCLVKYCLNANLESSYQLCKNDFELGYPYYGFLLNMRYRRGLRRGNLMDLAKRRLYGVMGRSVPHDCADKIFKYMNDSDLMKFVDERNC